MIRTGLLARAALPALLLAVAACGAEEAEHPEPWLARLRPLVGQPLQAEGFQENWSPGGALRMEFRVVYADATHFRAEQTVKLRQPAAAMPQQPAPSASLTVADGSTLWIEGRSADGRPLEVMRMDLARFEDPGAPGLGAAALMVDPVRQASDMAALVNFQSVERSEGKVVLRGTLTDEGRFQLAPPDPRAPAPDAVVLVLEEATGFPLERELVGPGGTLSSLRVTGYRRPAPAELAPEDFQYAPPAGVPVRDMGAMMEQAGHGGQPPGAGPRAPGPR